MLVSNLAVTGFLNYPSDQSEAQYIKRETDIQDKNTSYFVHI